MTTLHICCNYAGPKVFHSLFAHLAAQGVRQTVYVPEKHAANMGRNLPGDGAFDVRYSLIVRPWDRLLYFTKARRALPDLMRRVDLSNVGLVHAHTLFTDGGIAYRLHRQTGMPFVVTVRSSDIEFFYKYEPHLRPHATRILRAARRVIFLSPAYRDRVLARYVPASLREELARKSDVVPNGIDEAWLTGRAHALRSDRLKIAFAGRLLADKQPDKAIEAAQELARRLPEREVTIELAGDGPLRPRLQAMPAVQAGRARLLGNLQGREALEAFYDGCDLLLVPSRVETFGLVYLEAMSRGLPVLYTRGQGFDGQFAPGAAGFAVDADSVADMADKALQCLEGYEARSARCLELAKTLAWPRVAGRLREIYEEACAR